MTESPRSPALGGYALSGAVLLAFNFAVAAPILDVLGRHPQFFVAHGLLGRSLLGFGLAVTVVLPLVLVGTVLLVRAAHRRAGELAGLAVVGALAGVFTWYLARTVPLHAVVAGPLALAGAAGAVVALRRLPGAQTAAKLGPLAPVVILAVFFLASPASSLIAETEAGLHRVAIGNPASVVVIIFDELPMVSLVGDDGEIDGGRLPNFGRLAAESVVYREARTVAESTYFSLPAILTGRYPDPESLPIAAHYPDSIFTLLGGSYDVVSVEPITELCPASACETELLPTSTRLRRLGTDVAVVYGHVVLPTRLARQIPALDDRWAGFAGDDGPHVDETTPDERHLEDFEERARRQIGLGEVADIEAFIDQIGRAEPPALLHLHSLLPHAPWRFLPSGQRYDPPSHPPARESSNWTQDAVLVAQGYQRHLLQVGYADTLLGQIIDALEDADLYDDAVIVVTADHGAAFEPGSARRLSRPEQRSDIVGVPLIIKPPGGTDARTDDRAVELIDVLPTIAGMLETRLPWQPDGHDLADPDADERTTHRLWRIPMEWHEFPVGEHRLANSLERRRQLIGPLEGPLDLYRLGPHGDLVGEPLAGLDVSPVAVAGGEIRISGGPVGEVDLDDAELPVLVQATAVGLDPGSWVAVSLNGTVAAVARTYDAAGGTQLQAQIPPEMLRRGRNTVTFHLVTGSPGREELAPISAEGG